ncbi:hypothetical protein [Curtobacterium luteum]|uniref:hypothetical protein n=1 Tax=Curtobacterium luteum TaxID=33881 RepID=UPI000B2EB020|nr:hypothetical protein [Curtobacterium luteum]
MTKVDPKEHETSDDFDVIVSTTLHPDDEHVIGEALDGDFIASRQRPGSERSVS